MKVRFAVLTTVTLSVCFAAGSAKRADFISPGPIHAVTQEPGVLPSGTPLLIRTNDAVRTRKAAPGTIYDASTAEDVLDQNGSILIPKASPVQLEVRSLPFLGPGGVMTELTLGVRTITVNGVAYPLATKTGTPDSSGLVTDNDAPKVVGGGKGADRSLITGKRINVPAKSLLSFRIADQFRLRGYSR